MSGPTDATPASAPRAPVDGARVYELVVPIRWGDMDAVGHVNNTVYFRYMEQARIEWFNALGIFENGAREGPMLANAACDFLRAFVYPGDVLVRQTVTRVGRSSLDTEVEMWRTDAPDTLYARGKAVVVWMDYQTGKSVPWPDALRRRLEG